MSKLSSIVGVRLAEKYESLRALLAELSVLAVAAGADDEARLLRDREGALGAAALFVVVGEVKAGKSSFINALLREKVCEVDAKPCTATIQELVHGDQKSTVDLGPMWQRTFLPQNVLAGLTIVDTPGTNSVIKHHQTITENYLPHADLVIFVLPAKNPHTGTAWDLLSLIREDWHRRVVFVLQQMDLTTRAELETNLQCVRDYARQHNVHDPQIFAVSALREEGGAADSGFAEFRAFIAQSVESGEVWRIKFDGGVQAAVRVAEKLSATLDRDLASVHADAEFLAGLGRTLEARRRKAADLRQILIQSLSGTYSSLTDGLVADFEAGLGIGTILRRSLPIIRDKTIPAWLDELRKDFAERAARRIDEDAARSSAQLTEEVDNAVEELTAAIDRHQLARPEPLRLFTSASEGPLASLRRNLDKSRLAGCLTEGLPREASFSNELLTAGGVLAMGVIIASVTKLVIFDITGGILAGLGLALVAGVLLWKRGAILADLRRKIADGRQQFENELDRSFGTILDRLFHEMAHTIQTAQEETARQNDTLGIAANRTRELLGRAQTLSRDERGSVLPDAH